MSSKKTQHMAVSADVGNIGKQSEWDEAFKRFNARHNVPVRTVKQMVAALNGRDFQETRSRRKYKTEAKG